MDKRHIRLGGWVLVWMVGCALWWWRGEPVATAAGDQWTIPPLPPVLVNGSFECTNGFTLTQNAVGKDIWIPNGWTPIFALGFPRLLSTRLSETNVCHPDSGGHVTRQDGIDSWYLPSQDIATPPTPGKPFDLILYQQVPATYGGEYSLSGWLTSECGDDKDGPNPCPQGNYVAKSIGIDPNGGIDYTSPAIEWTDENHKDRGWQNMYTSTRALTDTITIFARVRSPFQFHNNKGFVDAFSLVRAPLSVMSPLSPTIAEIGEIMISWGGQQSEDIAAIVAGNYDLLFDVQARALPNGDWSEIVTGATDQRSTLFHAPCLDTTYQFRVRARAEQPDNEEGSSPNHRYPGVWSKSQSVLFTAPISDTPPITDTPSITETTGITPSLYLPVTANGTTSGGGGC